MARALSDSDVAARLVRVYFESVARLGLKRSLDLDAVVNSYLYTLSRIKTKDCEREKKIGEVISKLETQLSTETKEEILPQPKIV